MTRPNTCRPEFRFLLFFCLLFASASVTPIATAQDPDVGANGETTSEQDAPPPTTGGASPRELFQVFIESWNRATARNREREFNLIDTEERRRDLLNAVRCLENGRGADTVSQSLFDAAGRVIDILNYHGKIDFDTIPLTVTGDDRFEFSTSFGDVVTVRRQDRWYFSSSFVTVESHWILGRAEESGKEKYQAFSVRDFVPSVLRNRALFLEHWQWLAIASLLIAAWLVHRIVTFLSRSILMAWAKRRSEGDSTSEAVRALGTALGYFAAAAVIALLHPYVELLTTGEKALRILAKLVASVGGLLLAYRLADLAGARLRDVAEKTDSKLDDQLAPMLERSLKVLITIGAFLFVLDNLDVDILSFLAGLGVVGIGVGLAARDTFANFFGSVTVFADKPFQVGDWIVVNAVEGTVEEIGFRTTRIRTFYNSVVALPNSKLVDSAIDNMGRRRWRRYKTRLGVLYSTPSARIEAFCEGIREIVRANDRMRQDYAMVYLNDFGGSALEILVYVFFDVEDWQQELRARQDFMLEVIRLAEHLGVGFAFPTTSIHVESTPEHPLQIEAARPGDELKAEVSRFGPGGNLAQPDGSPSFPR